MTIELRRRRRMQTILAAMGLVVMFSMLNMYRVNIFLQQSKLFVDRVANWTFNYWQDDMIRSKMTFDRSSFFPGLESEYQKGTERYGPISAYPGSRLKQWSLWNYVWLPNKIQFEALAQLTRGCGFLTLVLEHRTRFGSHRVDWEIVDARYDSGPCPETGTKDYSNSLKEA